MYYLLYIPIYLFSLLPLRVMHLISDIFYVLIYYIFGYRKQVVLSNLELAFPEKTPEQRIRIAKDFYHNFLDTIFETFKFISWKPEVMEKYTIDNFTGAMEQAYATGKNIYIVGMHNFNWEYANWGVSYRCKLPFLGIYMPLANKHLDRIMYNARKKPGTHLLPATRFKDAYLPFRHIRHVMATVADQSPGSVETSYWLNFFGKPTAFVTGTERGAKSNDAAIVFAHFFKTKRGYYELYGEFVTGDVNSLKDGELTCRYVSFIEKCIRKDPANYLWSHRRWKHVYKPEYGPLLNAGSV